MKELIIPKNWKGSWAGFNVRGLRVIGDVAKFTVKGGGKVHSRKIRENEKGRFFSYSSEKLYIKREEQDEK